MTKDQLKRMLEIKCYPCPFAGWKGGKVMIDRAGMIPMQHGVDHRATQPIVVAPSILSADFAYLADEVRAVARPTTARAHL